MPASKAFQGGGNRWLTNLSVANIPEDEYFAHVLLPQVPVPAEEFEYLLYDDNAFVGVETAEGSEFGRRQKGDNYDTVDWSTTDAVGNCYERGIETPIDKRDQREGKVKGMDVMSDAADLGRIWVLTQRERAAAALLFNVTTFAGKTSALTSTTQWDASTSNPLTQRNLAMRTIRRSAAMGKPGRIVGLHVGAEVHDALMDNGKIIERIKYTQKVDVIGHPEIASYFGVARYTVGTAIYNTVKDDNAGTLTGADIWGKYALFYVTAGRPGKKSPSLGYSFETESFMQENYYSAEKRSDVVRSREVEIPLIVNNDAGYLFSEVVS